MANAFSPGKSFLGQRLRDCPGTSAKCRFMQPGVECTRNYHYTWKIDREMLSPGFLENCNDI